MSAVFPPPAADEYAPFYAGYVARVTADADDALARLVWQLEALPAFLDGIPEDLHGHRYAPGKWSIREVVGHLADAERIFAYRMLRVARGDRTPLPGFEEDDYVTEGRFETRTLASLTREWEAVRRATLELAASLDAETAARGGIANGAPVTARALAWILAGHTEHHRALLAERYLQRGA